MLTSALAWEILPNTSWLSTGVLLVAFLAAAASYLRGARDKGTIATLESNNKALDARVTILETDLTAERLKTTALQEANEVLTNTVNSKPEIAELKTLMSELIVAIAEHHNAAMGGVKNIHEDLRGLPERLAEALKEH